MALKSLEIASDGLLAGGNSLAIAVRGFLTPAVILSVDVEIPDRRRAEALAAPTLASVEAEIRAAVAAFTDRQAKISEQSRTAAISAEDRHAAARATGDEED